MKRLKSVPRSTGELRRLAEIRLHEKAVREESPPPHDSARLVHELQVHELELEMQNEELLHSRAELEAALERYAELYDFAPVGYFTLGPDGVIRQCNLTGARLLGTARAQLLNRRLGAFIAAEEARAFESLLATVRESGMTGSVEAALKPAAGVVGEPAYAQFTVSLAPETGECRAVLVDVTHRRKAEEQLRSSQKLDAIGRLAGGVAHDFNNLLTVILNHAALALKAVDHDTPLGEGLVELQAAGERAAALTRQLLAFGRKQVLQSVVVDPNELVRELAKLLRSLLGANVELVLKLGEELGQVVVDPIQFERVIVNLVINARDAMPEGGRVTISTANIDVEATSPLRRPMRTSGSFVRVAVNDTGVGMDKTTMARVFEPFFTTKEKDRGTGFGLSTVYGIVKQCEGEISVRSEPGTGTTFEIDFRRAAAQSSPESKTMRKRARPAGGTETVLVVEDEESLRRVTERILAAAGYTVLTAANGMEALEICERYSSPIHLALTDQIMPGISGVVFATRLKNLRPETKVLHMSGYCDEAVDQHGAIDRAAFISKPFSAEALARKIREMLDSAPPAVLGAGGPFPVTAR